MDKKLIAQQGDVLFYATDSLPEGEAVKGGVVAEGEATGHFHAVKGRGVRVINYKGSRFVHAPKGGSVTHQEHGEIKLPPGNYEIGIVQEYDHFAEAARNVRD